MTNLLCLFMIMYNVCKDTKMKYCNSISNTFVLKICIMYVHTYCQKHIGTGV